ncbi:MAG: type IV pilin protein, partial [Prochlorococcus sp.]
MANKLRTAQAEVKGFTLTEVLITIVIVGILSAVALPNYFRQVQRTRQSEAASTLSQLSTIVAAYEDE